MILDEYGTVEGLLTLTDILQAIVGDMPEGTEDEAPPGGPAARRLLAARWPDAAG